MSAIGEKEKSAHCRQCGGNRTHKVLAKEKRPWGDQDVFGCETWFILECAGCHTIGSAHEEWNSEEYDYDDEGNIESLTRITQYPPSSTRQKPDYGFDLFCALSNDELWIDHLHGEIYAALGLKSFSLAAMGIRTIVDYIVTSKSGEESPFPIKVKRLLDSGEISELHSDSLIAAFEMGSATDHRGHRPSESDTFLMLDIAEALIVRFYIAPIRAKHQAEAAARMKERIPARQKKATKNVQR